MTTRRACLATGAEVLTGRVAVFALLCCCRLAASQASGITQFTDRVTWQNASTGTTALSFAGLGGVAGDGQDPDKWYPSGLNVSGVTFQALQTATESNYLYVRTAATSFIFSAGDSDLGCQTAHGPCAAGAGMKISLPPGTTALGIDLSAFWPTAGVSLTFSNGQTFGITSTQTFGQEIDVFAGFVSSTPFTSVVVQSGGLPLIKGLSFGNASTTTAPFISPNGVVPLNSTKAIIQPGEWISIYGSSLAGSTQVWNNNFPASLGGTSVTIDGKPAYIWYVSPGQINLQAPDDGATGKVSVVVSTPSGSVTSQVTLAAAAPSFSLLDSTHVTGIIHRSNGSGLYGGGSYDILGPSGSSLGYPTVAAKAGESVELYGVGFGPTSPVVPAGQVFYGAAPITGKLLIEIGGGTSPVFTVTPDFVGLTSAGLYQINLKIPVGVASGDFSLTADLGGLATPTGVVISLQ